MEQDTCQERADVVARSYGWGWSKVSRFSGTRCGQKIGGATLTPLRDFARRPSYTFRVIKRILMVDDEPAVIELLKEFFKQFQHGHAYEVAAAHDGADRKSTRLNSSHSQISYAVFCLKKKKTYSTR